MRLCVSVKVSARWCLRESTGNHSKPTNVPLLAMRVKVHFTVVPYHSQMNLLIKSVYKLTNAIIDFIFHLKMAFLKLNHLITVQPRCDIYSISTIQLYTQQTIQLAHFIRYQQQESIPFSIPWNMNTALTTSQDIKYMKHELKYIQGTDCHQLQKLHV